MTSCSVIDVAAAGGDAAISRFGGRLGPGDSPRVGDVRGVAGEVIANAPTIPTAPLRSIAVGSFAPLAMFSRFAVAALCVLFFYSTANSG